jgi:hypothetical protein
MFKQLFNFGFQRTALQAFGWYLFFLLLAVLLGMVAGIVAFSLGYVSANDFVGSMHVGERVAPVIPMMVGVVLLLEKPFTPTSVIVTLVAFGLAFLFGWFGAGIPLAFLTTRPSRESAVSPPIALRRDSWRQN